MKISNLIEYSVVYEKVSNLYENFKIHMRRFKSNRIH